DVFGQRIKVLRHVVSEEALRKPMVLQGGEQQQARESTVAGMPFQYFLGNRGKRLSIAAGLAKVFRHTGVPGRTAVTLDHRPVEFFLRREMPEDNRLVHPRAMGDL